MKYLIFLIILLSSFYGYSQSLFVPSNPDSIKVPVNVSNTVRTVYEVDLNKNTVSKVKQATDSGTLRGLINTNITNISANTSAISGKQATLVSGTNIKTINSSSILGSGDIVITSGADRVDTLKVLQTASYVIEKLSTTYYARPAYKSGLPAYSGSVASTVINSAIAALSVQSGGTIYNRAVCTITAKIVDGGVSNVNLIFERGSKWVAGAAMNDHVLDITSVNHWRVINAEIDGSTATQTSRTVDPSCIHVSGCNDVIIDHCNIYGGHEFGIYFQANNTFCGATYNTVYNCDWNLITIGYPNNLGVFIEKNEVYNAGDVGITTISSYTTVKNNYVHDIQGSLGAVNGRWGISIEKGTTDLSNHNTIEGNLIRNVNIGIQVSANADSNTINRNEVYDWDLNNGFLAGMNIYSNYNTVSNNTLSKSYGSAAIAFDVSGSKNIFIGNRTTGTRGFVIETNADNNILQNNIINATSAAIWVSSSTDDNTRIINNDWKGSGADVTDAGTGTIYGDNVWANGTMHLSDSAHLGLALKANIISPSFTTDITTPLLLLPTTTSTVGQIKVNGVSFLHAYGTDNTYLGSNTGNFTMTGGQNVGVGFYSLASNTTGSSNSALGYAALRNNTSGINNTAIGYGSLYTNTTGSYNTANGQNTLYYNTIGSYNTANGQAALYYNTTGNSNTAIGLTALQNNTTGSYNTAVGYRPLFSNTTGLYNTANGSYSLYSNTTGGYNTAIGYQSTFSNTTGVNLAAVGQASLYSNTTGNNNVALGQSSLQANTTGSNSTAAGTISLYSNTTGDNNAAFGFQSLYYNTTGTGNSAVGQNALLHNTTASNNTALGQLSLQANTTGSNNTANGRSSLQSNTTGANNTAIGLNSLLVNTTGSNNTATGIYSLQLNTTGNSNTGIGYAALSANTIGNNNNALGLNSLQLNTTGNSNTGIGYGSLQNNTTGSNNTAIGNQAGLNNTTGSTNIFAGYNVNGPTIQSNNKLYISNQNDSTGAFIYGVMDVGSRALNVNGKIGLSATGGLGYMNYTLQSSNPATPASGFNLFANSTGKFAWVGTNGFVRTFDGTANTADRVYTLQNKSYTIADSADVTLKANIASPTFTGVVTLPTPFTLAATSVASTGTQLNYLNAATGTTGTTSTNIVYSTSPTLITPVLGTPTSVNLTNGTALPESGVTSLVADLALKAPIASPNFTTTAQIGGITIPTISSTSTFTNKRITKRLATNTSTLTPTFSADTTDIYTITQLSGDISSVTITGTPTDGQTVLISITGTASRAIVWGASFESSTITLPITTSGTNRLDMLFVWNVASSKWRLIGVA